MDVTEIDLIAAQMQVLRKRALLNAFVAATEALLHDGVLLDELHAKLEVIAEH